MKTISNRIRGQLIAKRCTLCLKFCISLNLVQKIDEIGQNQKRTTTAEEITRAFHDVFNDWAANDILKAD